MQFAQHLRSDGIDPIAARQAARTRDELLRQSRRLLKVPPREPDEETLLKLPLFAYPDRVVRRRDSDPAAGTMVGGGGVRLAPESIVRQAEFYLALDARHDQRSQAREAMVRIASAIDSQWLEELFPNEIRRQREVTYDAQPRSRVVSAKRDPHYRDLLLPRRDRRCAPVGPDQASAVLAQAARPQAAEILLRKPTPGCPEWIARIELLREIHARPSPGRGWTPTNWASFCNRPRRGNEALKNFAAGHWFRCWRDCSRIHSIAFSKSMRPTKIAVPSGSQIRVSYVKGESPVMEVRLQELFGWMDTPKVADSRVPILLHLLAAKLPGRAGHR